jgi:integrase
MARGAAVIRRTGTRGVTWAIKFRDAEGRQVWETLGREPEWNEPRAQRELGKRLQAVQRERWRKPERMTFASFADRFERDYLPGRNLKHSTQVDYRLTIRRHLRPFFGHLELSAVEPVDVDAYVAEKIACLAPKTISNHLSLLRLMFKTARRWRLVAVNPLEEVEPPRVERHEMHVLTGTEIARLLTAYEELRAETSETVDAEWWALTRRLVQVALGTALRRGELLALRWRDVELLDHRLTVRESFVRGRFQTPKSKASRRTIELGPRTAAVLQQHWRASRYQSDDSLVFCHPLLGTPLDPSKISGQYMRPALKKAGIVKPFRPWHDLRHTALTHEAAAGNPQAYVQLKAGHSQGSITERYIHAAQVLFPGAAAKGETRMFGVSPDDEAQAATS